MGIARLTCVPSDRTLTSYSNLTQTLSPSSNSDIKAYKRWIKERNLIAEPEDSFLKLPKDLVTVSHGRRHPAPTSLKYSPVTVALTILTTIIVFKFVPQFFARLVMSAVIGLALMCMVSPSSLMDLQALKEKKKGVGVYVGPLAMLLMIFQVLTKSSDTRLSCLCLQSSWTEYHPSLRSSQRA